MPRIVQGSRAGIFVAVLLAAVAAVTALPASGIASTALDLPGCRENTLHRNDDESSGSIELPFEVDFYGSSYESLYLNNNGNVTFDSPLGTYIPFDLTQTDRVIIAPFFADVDTRPADGGTVTYGETTYEGRPAFCALWDEVGYYPNGTDRRNTFQLLLVRGTPGTGDFNIVFRYASIQWELGSASNGVAARVGFSNGDPARSAELGGSAQSGAFLDGGPHALTRGSVGSSTPGTWIFSVRDGAVGNDPRNVPPGFSRESPWWTWPDQDGDGLPSYWESNGVWVDDRLVNLAGHGADPAQKDAFVYVDVVSGERWNSTIEGLLRSSFGSSPLNIRLHIIRGPRVLGRSEVPPVDNSDAFFSQMVRLGFTGTGLSGSPGSVPALAKYVCVCPDHRERDTIGGVANGIKADHLIVTVYEARWLAEIKRQTGISFSNNDLVGDQLNAVTTMHELGHLYGLRHHGKEHTPVVDHEYLSIMSYAYSAFGVPRTPEEVLAGKLLPRIDYSRRNVKNLDWRMGGTFGALSLVYGQHGERGNFYSTIEEIPSGAEEAPAEAGIDELLADPAIAEQIAKAARDIEAASRGPAGPASNPPAVRGRVALGRPRVKGGRVLVRVSCDSSGPCAGKLEVTVARPRPARAGGQRRGGRPQVIAKATFSLAPASARTASMKLTPAGLRRLRQAGRGGLRATLKLDGRIDRRFRLVRVA
ncbi:MAG TPA: nidogen-like domain-containing protein [Solirubrobacterales bacterium]|nr:nidogen-like domain-containing protein [Solirubrobacterales bacterium]